MKRDAAYALDTAYLAYMYGNVKYADHLIKQIIKVVVKETSDGKREQEIANS